jgi:hypothetical protein
MTRGVHGGYDQAIFIDQQLASLLARFSFALGPTGPIPFGGGGPPAADEQARGTLSLTPQFRYLFFTTEPAERLRSWIPDATRPWEPERRNETDTVTLVIEIQAEIFFSGIRVGIWRDVAQQLADLEQRIMQEPNQQTQEELRRQRDELRRAWTAPLHGYLRITDRVEPRRLVVGRDRTDPSITAEAWCAVIDFRPDARRGHPQVRVWLDPLVTFASPRSQAAIALQIADPNLEQLALRIATEIPARLSSMGDWRMPEPGLTALSITPLLGTPRDPANLVVRTLPMKDATPADSSCIVLLSRIISPEGDAALAGRAVTVNDRALQIAVANQYLLRGLILPALLAGLSGVSEDDFSGGPLPVLRYPVDLEDVEAPTRCNSIAIWVDEAETVRIGLRLTINHPLFDADATGVASITFAAATAVREGLPVLRITPTVTATVTVEQVRIAWWVAALLGIAGLWIILGPILDNIFQGRVRDKLQQQLAQPADPIDTPLPGGVEFTVSDVSLMQESAESVIQFPVVVRTHDLVITLSALALPQTLDISCVAPDTADPGGRLDAVGGILPNGSQWGLSIDDAIAAAQAGTTFVSVAPDGSRAAVQVVEPEGRPPFLQTVPDPSTANNLLNLPPCA